MQQPFPPEQPNILDDALDPQDRYPLLLDRVQSTFIDLIIVVILMILCSSLLEKFESPPDWIRIVMFFAIWILYEPLLITINCTPGQYIKGIRVRDHDRPAKRIGILPAVIRYIVKILLGWISFLTLNSNPEKRAMHDFSSGSVMIKV